MIKMQMRVDDVVDSTWLPACIVESIEKLGLQVVPPGNCGALLAVSDTRIHDDHLHVATVAWVAGTGRDPPTVAGRA